MSVYTTKAGDMLDDIAFRFYGSTLAGQVETLLEANRALDLGQYITLPAGLSLELPEIEPAPRENVRLFD
jgi:phage tail protein X